MMVAEQSIDCLEIRFIDVASRGGKYYEYIGASNPKLSVEYMRKRMIQAEH